MIDLAQLLGFDRDVKPYTEVNYKQDSSGSAKFVLTPIASSVLDSMGHFYIFCAVLTASVISSFFVNTSLVIVVSSVLLYAICLNAFRFGAAPNLGGSDDERYWLLGWGIFALLITLGLWEVHTAQSGWINILQPIVVGLSMICIWFTNRRIYVTMKEDLTDHNYNKSYFWMYITRTPFIGLLSYTYVYSIDTTVYWIGLFGFTSGVGVMYTIIHIVGINDDKLEGASETNNSNTNRVAYETDSTNNTTNNTTNKNNTNTFSEDTNTFDTSSKILDNINSDNNNKSENDTQNDATEDLFDEEATDEDDQEKSNESTNKTEKPDNKPEEEIIIGSDKNKNNIDENTPIPEDKTEELIENLRQSINNLNKTLENKNMDEYKLTEIEQTPPTENNIKWISTETDKLRNYLIDNEMDENIQKELIDVKQYVEEIKEYIYK